MRGVGGVAVDSFTAAPTVLVEKTAGFSTGHDSAHGSGQGISIKLAGGVGSEQRRY